MTPEEIINLAYDHANCFTSGIVFSDQGLVDFANALLGAAPETVPVPVHEPEPERDYRDPFTDAYFKAIRGE